MKTIAEISSNFSSLEDCILSIKRAKEAKSWAVKFQLFSPQDLYGHWCKDAYTPGVSPFLDPKWLPALADEAKQVDIETGSIEFMCTAFSSSQYEYVNDFVNIHKIASAEMTDTNILKTVNSFKKPVMISTGGSNIDEIHYALSYLKDCPVTIMFCVAEYPANIIDFRKLQALQKYFDVGHDFGFSDHSKDIFAIPQLAKQLGCYVIEKHCNLADVKESPDLSHSISFKELEFMNRALQNNLSTSQIESHINTDMRLSWRRRFVATTDIQVGDKITVGRNVDIFRCKTKSIDPVITFRPQDINGKTCLISKRQGDPICYGDYEIDID